MRRTIPILRGLAILGVVFNHANWHVLSTFAPGDPWGYLFVALDQVGKFAIPAFMFIAGYFIAYATGGGKQDLSWKIVRARIGNLLWPWLIWSAIMVVGQSFQGRALSPAEFLRNLIIQYYFIPLLIMYYLLAPLTVKWARSNARRLLAGAAIVQALTMGLFYARVYHPGFPGILKSWIDLGPLQYLRFAFYFPLGVVCGMAPRLVKDSLARLKPILPWLVAGLFALTIVETALVYNAGGRFWSIGGDQTKLSSALCSTALILCFVLFDKLTLPFSQIVDKLGMHSYGLYLCHYPVLGILAQVIERLLPWVVSQGWLYLPMLFVLTVASAMLLMESTAKLPTRRFYHYLFG